jgi:hypothetical protein
MCFRSAMRPILLALTFSAGLAAQPLPVTSFQLDPEQVVRSLRDRRPAMSVRECQALNLWECHPDEPTRLRDISLRWVQLDTDAQLEAIIVIEAKVEDSNVAYVFDKQTTWNLVGSFFCRRNRCDVDRLVRVQQLTIDSPPLLLSYRDLGGSGLLLFYIEAFHLRAGQLWPSFKLATHEYNPFANSYSVVRRVSASDHHLVVHTGVVPCDETRV